ncbi:MAG: hypothetical protein WD313_05150, partial [Acidimicrobiia bacterium]
SHQIWRTSPGSRDSQTELRIHRQPPAKLWGANNKSTPEPSEEALPDALPSLILQRLRSRPTPRNLA